MPFTPFHMGPGLLVKALLQGSFSLMVFGWTQIVMDIQPLLVLVTGAGHLHGFSHSYIGATLIAAASALTGKYLAEFGLRLMGQARYLPISWPVATMSAAIGAYSHVVLDSLIHADLEPFAPFATVNPFLGFVSVTAIYQFCVYSGLAGVVLYFVLAFWLERRRHRL